MSKSANTPTALGIGISISDSPDLAAHSMGPAHLRDALVEISRFMLAGGHSLAYGGDLRRDGFTEVLFELLAAYREANEETPDVIHSYLAWPLYLDLDTTRRAELKQIAAFHPIPPPPGVNVDLTQKLPPTTAENRVVWARCLTHLRRVMNDALDARILLGGQLRGLGRYPGIAEEAALMMEAGKPVFLVGAFGGCSASIIESLKGDNPEALTEEFQSREEVSREFIARYRATPDVEVLDYAALNRFFRERGVAGLNNRLSAAENDRLFVTPYLPEIVALILRGITRLARQ